MLQRSPSYVASIPSVDRIGIIVSSIMPKNLAFKVNRFKNIFLARYLYFKARKNPEKSRNWFRKKVIKELGTNYPVDLHFNPKYDPWDQRVCMVPDGDIFSAIRDGKASIVTDEIDQFDASGISLKSCEHLDADIIVSATGLEVLINGGCEIYIDRKKQELADCFGYKGTMYSGIPNYFSIFGYTNASWTLRVNLISEFVLRVIEYVKINEYKKVVPIVKVRMQKYPWINFQAGYFLRVMDKLPNQGDRHPWLNLQDYKIDKKLLTQDPIDDGDLIFSD
jgi:cation diffusion facilitator CzcD-associated flavoprotein CzcO